MTKAPYFFIDLANLPDTLVWVASDPAALASDLQSARVDVGAGHGDRRMGLLIGFDIAPEPAAMVWRDRHHMPVIAMVLKWRVCSPHFEDDLDRFPRHRAGSPIHRDAE